MVNVDLNTNLAELLSLYPQTAAMLRKYGIPTAG